MMSKISKTKRRQAFDKTKGLCANCKTQLEYATHNWNVDHMREKQFGGSSDIANLQAVCKQCHIWKNLIINANKTEGLIPTDDDLEEQEEQQEKRFLIETVIKIEKLTGLVHACQIAQQDANNRIDSFKHERGGHHKNAIDVETCKVKDSLVTPLNICCLLGTITVCLYSMRNVPSSLN